MLETHLCKDCGQAMEVVEQEMRQAQKLTLVTCKNRACGLWSVTLSTQQYAAQTDAQWQDYRDMVARLKKTMRL